MPGTLEPEQGQLEQMGKGKEGKKRIGAVKDKGPTPVGPVDKCVLSELGVTAGFAEDYPFKHLKGSL